MPRPRNLSSPTALRDVDLNPVVGGRDLVTALFAISTWGSSTTFRRQLMESSGFPLVNDVSAFLVVNQLIYRGLVRPTELADAIDTGRSNISKVVARLEAARLILRTADPSDDRAVVVVLTEEGRKVAERIVESAQSLHLTDSDAWSAEDTNHLGALLVKLAAALDADPSHPLSTTAGVSFQA